MGEAREIFFFCQNVPVGPKRVKNVKKKKKIVKNCLSPTISISLRFAGDIRRFYSELLGCARVCVARSKMAFEIALDH